MADAADPRLPGSQWFYTGSGAANLALGGEGGSGRGSVFDVIRNPAALALSENLLIGLGYGALGTPDSLADIGLSLPEDFGVLTFNLLVRNTGTVTNRNAGAGVAARGNLSKLITPNFHFGLGAGLFFANSHPDSSGEAKAHLGTGIDLGFIILQNGTVQEIAASQREEGFGFFDRIFSFSLNNIGLNITWENWKQYPDPQALAGFEFTFFKDKIFRLETNHALGFSFDDASVRYSGGISGSAFGIARLHLGLMLGNSGLGPFSLGLGLDLRSVFPAFGFDLSWAMVPFSYNGTREVGHFLTMNLIFGSRDYVPPAPDIKSRYRYFSPNDDGIQDTTTFDLLADAKQEIAGWQVTIRDANNRVVRQIGNKDETGQRLTPGKFFTILFSSRRNVSVPSSWEWDGRDDAGKILGDGTYLYQLKVQDARGNEGVSQIKPVEIRTAQPQAEVDIKLSLFSPNRGKGRDLLTIEQTLTGRDTRWTGYITDTNGKVVRTFSWGENAPSRFTWDGKDDNGRTAADGNYEYRLEGREPAGNSVSRKSGGIVLSTRVRAIKVSASAEIFAPGSDSGFGSVRFSPELETRDLLENWKLTVTDREGSVQRSFESKSAPPREIAWDGRNAEGAILPDGIYNYTLQAEYMDGDSPRTKTQPIRILTQAPLLKLDAQPRLYAPDDSGDNKRLRISLDFAEAEVISNWRIDIKNSGQIFKSFSGESPKTKTISIQWDGKGDSGELVESAATYTLEAKAGDIIGNAGTSNIVSVDIDILVIRTPRGLKILLTNIEFAYNQWELEREESPVLNRVAEVLKRYGDYKIIIEGHSDSIGGEEYNLMLSTRRARTVLRYLLRRGIEDKRMIAKGLGLSVPVASNATEEGRARNRRVEFILVKDE
jgi:outer membrane protein OmpA-like peptidoglycan-associated protein